MPVDEHGLPKPLGFRPAFDWKALVLGALLTVAVEVVFQQLGESPVSSNVIVEAVVLGTVAGVLFPSLGRLLGVIWVNSAVRKARRELGLHPATTTAAAPPPPPPPELAP